MNWVFANRDWLDDCDHYVRCPTPRNLTRVQFRRRKLEQLREETDGNFCLIIGGDQAEENDYYVLPYRVVAALLTQDTLDTTLEDAVLHPRWLLTISEGGSLSVEGGQVSPLPISVNQYRGLRCQANGTFELPV